MTINKSYVSVVKSSSYDFYRLKRKIKKSLDLIGGLGYFIRPYHKVLLKPNLFGPVKKYHPSATHYNFIKAIVELIIEIGADPVIGESICGDNPSENKKAFANQGLIEIAREYKIKLFDFQTGDYEKVKVKNPYHAHYIEVSKKFLKADIRINLPKFKTHMHTAITGAVKNSYGCISHRQRQYLHRLYQRQEFCKAVVDVFSATGFDLTVMDAIDTLQGDNGPAQGPINNLGYIISSTDSVSVDSIASYISGHSIVKIPTNYYAAKHGLGNVLPKNINLLGVMPKKKFFEKHPVYNYYDKFFVKKVNNKKQDSKFSSLFNILKITDDCVGCLKCIRACPNGAIKVKGSIVFIDEKLCIKCYCCAEICPNGAIKFENKNLFVD